MNAVIFKRFCDITTKLEIPEKEDYIFPKLGLSRKQIFEYFSKTNIQRTRIFVEMKCLIVKHVYQNNIKVRKTSKYFFALKEIAEMLFLHSHATVIHHHKKDLFKDDLHRLVSDNYISWIKQGLYPFSYRDYQIGSDNYILLKESEFDEIEMHDSRIKISSVHKLMNEKAKTPLLEG